MWRSGNDWKLLYEEEWISGIPRILGNGKEAETYLCTAHPRRRVEYVVAKVYRPGECRALQNDALYREGRLVGSRTVSKAMEQKSRFGRKGSRRPEWGRNMSILWQGVVVAVEAPLRCHLAPGDSFWFIRKNHG